MLPFSGNKAPLEGEELPLMNHFTKIVHDEYVGAQKEDLLASRCYHGKIDRQTSASRLMEMEEPVCYLFRDSSSRKDYLALDVKVDEEVIHFLIHQDSKLYYINKTRTFEDIDKLLSYYESHPLSAEVERVGVPCIRPSLQSEYRCEGGRKGKQVSRAGNRLRF